MDEFKKELDKKYPFAFFREIGDGTGIAERGVAGRDCIRRLSEEEYIILANIDMMISNIEEKKIPARGKL